MSPWADGDFLTSTNLNTKLGVVSSVRDYGAKGDGNTDDTAAFQAAANAGGTIYVPSPSVAYKILGQVVVSGNYRVWIQDAAEMCV